MIVPRADHGVVLDERAASDDDVVADRASLPHAGLIAHDHACAEHRSGEDDRARGDDRRRAQLQRGEWVATRRRARREDGLLADHGVVADRAAVPDPRALVHDGVLPEGVAHD